MSDEERHYRGGRVEPEASPDQSRRMRYPCFAASCPMPGTLFAGGTDKPGTCAWHYGIVPSDIPKVTQVLNDWMCVSAEINHARRCLSGALASDPAGLQREFDSAWFRLQPMAAAWEAQLAPGTIRTGKGVDTGHRQAYADWAKHLEQFVGARVVEVLSTRRAQPGPPVTPEVDEELPWQ